MVDSGLRARVVRLLSGDLRNDDLTRLFLYARDRCDGRESVQEIGDFVAHHDERTKGLVTRTARDWFRVARFLIPRIKGKHVQVDFKHLPEEFPEYLRASVRRVDIGTLKKNVGFGKPKVSRILPGAIQKLVRNADGTYSLSDSHTQDELDLIDFLCRHLTVIEAFSDRRLFDDFAATLKSHGLILKSELRDFESVMPAITLFAITVMHNSVIQMGDGTSIRLYASAQGGGKLDVTAQVPVEIPTTGTIFLASALFNTALEPSLYCVPELLELEQPWTRA